METDARDLYESVRLIIALPLMLRLIAASMVIIRKSDVGRATDDDDPDNDDPDDDDPDDDDPDDDRRHQAICILTLRVCC